MDRFCLCLSLSLSGGIKTKQELNSVKKTEMQTKEMQSIS